MTEQAFAILLASAFTFGCAVIQEWRENAGDLTPLLAATTACLALLALTAVIAQNGIVRPQASPARPAPHSGHAPAP